MAGFGAPDLEVVDAAGLTLGVVATRWHGELTDQMLDRALAAAKACGVDHVTVARVAGAVELPVVAQALAQRYDAAVALGVVIRGDTAQGSRTPRRTRAGRRRSPRWTPLAPCARSAAPDGQAAVGLTA